MGSKRRTRQTGQSIVTLSLRDGVVVDAAIRLVLLSNDGGLSDHPSQDRHGDELVLCWEQLPEERCGRWRLPEVQRQLPVVHGHHPGC
jgi:hypothetical protein